MPSSFTKVITHYNKPNFSNKDRSCVAMDYMVILFTLNNPTMICMDTHVSFKKMMTKEKISILLRDIHKSKPANTTIVDARFDRTCWSMVFLIMVSNTSQKKIEMEIEHGGIGVKLTSKAKHFHK